MIRLPVQAELSANLSPQIKDGDAAVRLPALRAHPLRYSLATDPAEEAPADAAAELELRVDEPASNRLLQFPWMSVRRIDVQGPAMG